MEINLLFPVLNEHKRLENGIEKTVRYMQMYVQKDRGKGCRNCLPYRRGEKPRRHCRIYGYRSVHGYRESW